MATYNVQKSAGGLAVAIPDAASPDTQTDLHLVGQNAVSYGLDVAQSFYFLLENFANTTEPANKVTGELWFDTTAGVLVLKVWNGSTWKSMAHTAVATTDSSMARWNDASQEWEENTQLTLSSTGVLTILDAGLTDSVAFSHDGTDFNIAGTLTTDINVTGVTAVNMPSATLTTALAETSGGTGANTYATGDILYASGLNTLTKLPVGANGDVLTLAAGIPGWVAGAAGVSALNDLTDVTLTAPANNSILYRSVGVYIDSDIAALSFDGTNLSATQIGGIVEANLLDKSAVESVAGVWTHTADVALSTANLTLTDNDQILFGTGAGDVAIDFDGTDFVINGPLTGDFTITGFAGGNVISSRPVHATSGGAESIRVIGDAATWATADSYISFYDSDASEHGLQIGTIVADGSAARVNARLGNLQLYATDSLTADIGDITTTWTSNGITSLVLRNAFLTGANATTSATVADHNDVQHNVGYNETPDGNLDVGFNLDVGSFVIDAASIGKLLTRNVSTSRTITLNTGLTDIPVGGSVLVYNANSAGTLTIVNGTITDLIWIDGSGTVPTTTANRVIANNSIVTLRKLSDTKWQIWGNGIS